MTSTVDDWESRLKDLIVADKELHLRILRYEVLRHQILLKLEARSLNVSYSRSLSPSVPLWRKSA